MSAKPTLALDKKRPTDKRRPGEDHPVIIAVNAHGDFTYKPSHVRARKGDTLTFSSEGNKPFEVVFKDHSPGDQLYFSNERPRLQITDDVPHGIYQYAAAVYDPEQRRVFLDSGCGDVGVEK